MTKNLNITICNPIKAKSRANVSGLSEFITDDSIYGISIETYEKITKTPFRILSSGDDALYIETEINGESNQWYIPKVFFDITE